MSSDHVGKHIFHVALPGFDVDLHSEATADVMEATGPDAPGSIASRSMFHPGSLSYCSTSQKKSNIAG